MNDTEWDARLSALADADPLSQAELLTLQDAAVGDPVREAELAFVAQLATAVDEPPAHADPADQALARKALASIDAPSPAAATPDRRRFGWAVGAVAVAAAAVVLAVASWPADEVPIPGDAPVARAEPTTISFASGQVTVGARAARTQTQVAEGAALTTADGTACMVVSGGIDVCAAAQTTLELVASAGSQRRIEVASGRAVARLDAQPEGTSFALTAGQLQAVAVGTIFSVSHDDAGVTAAVLQGAVRIRVGGDVVRLGVLEQLTLHDGRVERGKVDAARRDADLKLLAALPAPGAEMGFVAIAVDPPGTPVTIDGAIEGRSPLHATVATGVRRIDVGDDDGAGVSQNVPVQPGETARWDLQLTEPVETTGDEPDPSETGADEPAGEPDFEVPTAPDHATPAPTVEALLAQAREHRQHDRWRDAASTYRKLIRTHGRTTAARNAWLSLGDIQLDHLSQPKAALASYGRYLDRGGGALAQEARYGQIRARRRLGDHAGERKAIETFLRKHPTSARAASLRERQAELAP